MKSNKAFILYILISVVLWQLCISVSKILVTSAKYGNSDFVLFSISETTNKGAAFGILDNNAFILAILGVIILLSIAIYVFRCVKFEEKFKILSCAIFTSGILGNTYERITDGYVSDFIKLNNINFPVFNLFDVLICLSVFIYIFYFIKEEKK